MGILDIAKMGYEAIAGDSSKSSGGGGLTGGIFGKIQEIIGLKKPEIAGEAREVQKTAEKERGSLFSEIGRSLFLRQFPRAALAWDLYQGTKEVTKLLSGQKKMDSETLEHFLTSTTALLVLIPGNWKHVITDLFANSTIFRALIEYWPGLDGVDLPYIQKYLNMDIPLAGSGGSLRQRILDQKDPQAVILALRIMHQDIFVTGKVAFGKVKDLLGGSNLGSAAALLAGGAALTAEARALEGESGSASGPGTTTVEAVTAATIGTGALKGKKIVEMQKQHPELQVTTMQRKVIELLTQMNVLDSAVIVKGDWAVNNDEVTIGFTFDNAVYFMTFDEDWFSSDISVRNSKGSQIYESTDKFGLDAESDAEDIIEAMKTNPSDTTPKLETTPAPAK